MKLSGWGRYPVLDCRLEHLRAREDLSNLIERSPTLIARGNGHSYGDAALNQDLTVSMLKMNRIQAFDEKRGLLTCEAGVLLADILDTFVPRGWLPPVMPGTKFVTVGGMIAADVHGKNHRRDGSFGAHVESLLLIAADGEPRTCSRTENTDLFRATLGGMGLTGVILSASFRLQRIETAFVMKETLATRDLDETMALFEASGSWPYNVAWIDCLAQGTKQGRSLLMRGKFVERNALPPRLALDPLRPAIARQFTVPVYVPSVLLNRVSIRVFNTLYYHRGAMSSRTRPIHLDRFFFPLDRLRKWNRLYGRRGLVQYQCVLPKRESSTGIHALLNRVFAARHPVFLASLKLSGPAGEGLLSFPMEGYTLVLDFPMRSGTLALLAVLDEITHRHGGRVYLAKSIHCTPEQVRQGYPHHDMFNTIRTEAAGPVHRFASALSRRLIL